MAANGGALMRQAHSKPQVTTAWESLVKKKFRKIFSFYKFSFQQLAKHHALFYQNICPYSITTRTILLLMNSLPFFSPILPIRSTTSPV